MRDYCQTISKSCFDIDVALPCGDTEPMKFKNLIFFFSLFASGALFTSSALAIEVPAQWKFKKISTPHFDIIYNAEQQELGVFYAQQLEKAYALLSPVFTATPAKTLVIINDKTDSTNGYATRVPYPHIMTYPVLPGPNESLGETGDWFLELLGHEYVHILNFEPATGVFKVLRGVMGSIVAPNLLLPNWWKEGLAVQAESMLGTRGGRLKSLYQDAVIRAMVADRKLSSYDLAQTNEVIPTWPEGMRAYLFGSLFWSQAVADYGNSVMNNLNLRQSGRIPYFVEAPAQDLLKQSYEEAYNKALNVTNERAEAQIKILKNTPLTPIHNLPLEAKYSSAPAISADGQYLALITVDYKADRVMDIFVRDTETGLITKKLKVEIKKEDDPLVPQQNNHHDAPPSGSIQKIAWFNKSPKLIYDQLRYVNRIERYSDLHTYDVSTGKSQRISTALRAREPAVSPQDDKVAYVKLSAGRTQLGLYDLTKKKEEILFSAPLQERISSPTFVNENTLVFALRNSQGQEGLWAYSFTTKNVTPLLTNYEQARFPLMTKRGLLFTAANNGVHNLYLATADFKTARPVSHVLSMLSSSALDPINEHIYTTYMTSSGPAVVRIAKENWEKTPAQLPRIQGLFVDRYKEPLKPDPASLPAEQTYASVDYSAGPYLWPRYWIPFAWTSPEGGVVFQVQTSGFDPLKKHSYDAMVGWNTYLNAADWAFGYLNNVTNLPVQISGAQSHSYLVNRDDLIKDTLTSVSVLPDVWSWSDKLGLSIGWRYLERSLVGITPTKRTGPVTSLVYRNMTEGGEQFTPQTGGGAYLTAMNYIEGKDLMSHSQFLTGGILYFSKFLPKLHALVLRGSVLYTPEKIPAIYGTQSESMDYYGKDLGAKFLARGYSTGQFLGRSMYNASLEYRFLVKDTYKGKGTDPWFIRRLHGALITDAISTDGFVYDTTARGYFATKASDVFLSYGVELHLETTLGYILPANFVLGLYKGADNKYAPNSSLGLAIQFAGF